MSGLNEALLAVQKELEPVKKSTPNPFYKSKYADLEAVSEAVMPVLSKHGLVAIQTTRVEAGVPILVTRLVFAKTDEQIMSEIPVIATNMGDPQKVIAGLTYMRRASLTTICGLVTQDDDGNTASGKEPKKEEFKQPKAAPKPAEKSQAIGVEKTITFSSCGFDSNDEVFICKTDKGEVYYTSREVLAKIIRTNFFKPLKCQVTVNQDMQNVILEIIM